MKTFITRLIAVALVFAIIYFVLYIHGNIGLFIHVQSFIIVSAGTFSATLMTFSFSSVFNAYKHALLSLFKQSDYVERKQEIMLLIEIAEKIHTTNGLACIDQELEQNKHRFSDFLRYGLNLTAAGYSEDIMRTHLKNFAQQHDEELQKSEAVWFSFSEYAPGFGMIGTVIGMVLMLANLDVDISNIGQGLSIALITTLYGVVLSTSFLKPMAVYLNEERNETLAKSRVFTDALILMRSKANPILVKDQLNSSLPLKLQVEY